MAFDFMGVEMVMPGDVVSGLSYVGYTGRGADAVGRAVIDPTPTAGGQLTGD